MKHLFKILSIIIISICTLNSCDDDDPNKNSIFDTDEPQKKEFDRWLDRNFIDPFNINIKYKLED